jgi:hypothetical protein
LRRDKSTAAGDGDTYEKKIINEWCPQFVDPEYDTYNQDNKGRYTVEDYVKFLKEPLPKIDNSEELYCHYKVMQTPRIRYDIRKDIKRTDTLFRDLDDFDSEAS